MRRDTGPGSALRRAPGRARPPRSPPSPAAVRICTTRPGGGKERGRVSPLCGAFGPRRKLSRKAGGARGARRGAARRLAEAYVPRPGRKPRGAAEALPCPARAARNGPADAAGFGSCLLPPSKICYVCTQLGKLRSFRLQPKLPLNVFCFFFFPFSIRASLLSK